MELLQTKTDFFVEKPWHRLAVKLHLLGWTNHDIASELSKSVADVATLLTSKHGKEEIAKAIQDDSKAVERILEAAGLDSIYRLIQLRDSATSEAVKFNAAKTLLEQGFGRPLTKIKKIGEDTPEDAAEEAERLKKELGLTA